MKLQLALWITCALAGLGVGFAAARLASGSASASLSAKSAAKPRQSPPPPLAFVRGGASNPDAFEASERARFAALGLPLPPADPETAEAWRAGIDDLARRDPAAAFAAAAESADPVSWVIAFSALAEHDPAAAAAELRKLDPHEMPLQPPSPAWPRLVALLARQDPDAAAALASSKDGRVDSGLVRVLEEIRRVDWSLAAKFAGRLPGNSAERRGRALLAERWAREDPSAALAWARQHLGSNQYQQVLEKAIRGLGVAERREVIEQLPPGSEQISTCTSVAAKWARTSPSECLAWAEKLSSPSQRVAALRGAAEALCETDPRAAMPVIARLPDPDTQERLLRSALGTWRATDPDGATAYASALPDEELSRRMLRWLAIPPLITKPFGPVGGSQGGLFEGIEFHGEEPTGERVRIE